MMKKIRLILMTICVFILMTGCNSSNGAAPSEETTSVIEIAGIDSLSFNIFPYIYFALDKDIA